MAWTLRRSINPNGILRCTTTTVLLYLNHPHGRSKPVYGLNEGGSLQITVTVPGLDLG